MEFDNTTAALICAIGALLGYQYGTQVKRAARKAFARGRSDDRA
jgi:hypothetical protein